MTQLSCITSTKALLGKNVPELVSIQDIQEAQPTILPEQTPAVILQDGVITERRLAGGYGGSKLVEWELDAHIWGIYSDLSDPEVFRNLVDKVSRVFRTNHRLGATADTATTQVLFAGERQEIRYSPWQEASGMVIRHAVVTVQITEVVVDA